MANTKNFYRINQKIKLILFSVLMGMKYKFIFF